MISRRTRSADIETAREHAVSAEPQGIDGADVRRVAPKGRPTPKRREAQQRRAAVAQPAPRNRREASARSRDEARRRREERRAGMARGEDKYLPARDRGPVRRYARDIVDSRRSPLSFLLGLTLVMLVLTLLPNRRIQSVAFAVYLAALLVLLFDALVLGRLITKRVRARFPDHTERTFRLAAYAVSRATQFRRIRVPKPQVNVGERI